MIIGHGSAGHAHFYLLARFQKYLSCEGRDRALQQLGLTAGHVALLRELNRPDRPAVYRLQDDAQNGEKRHV